MTPEEQAKTLFTVESTGPFIYSPQNERFRVRDDIHFQRDEFASRSRSTTPAGRESSTPAPDVFTKTYLRFDVDSIQGQTSFLFGSKSEICDVYVFGPTIGDKIFAVELTNGGRGAMLKNMTRQGLNIESPVYGRLHFRGQRVLHPKDKVVVNLTPFNIELQFLDHRGHQALHEAYLQSLTPRLAQAVPAINQLHLYEEIGSGVFGTVYHAVHSRTGESVAVKVFRKQKPLKEAAILQSLDHPNIVRFIDFISPSAGGNSMLVMELVRAPNLEDAQEQQRLDMAEMRDLISELLQGLAYLHSMRVTHRDLKPANIMLVSRKPMEIKMTDFGLAIQGSKELKTHCGSLRYLAPEIHEGVYTNKVDIWSVGVIALELAGGLPDYPSGKHEHWPGLLRARLEDVSVDPQAVTFIGSLLRPQAVDRPSASQSLASRFLQVESYFHDAVRGLYDAAETPTEYNPTPPEFASGSGQPEASGSQLRHMHRSANAPSPSEYGAGQTQVFAPRQNDPLPAPAAPAPGPMPRQGAAATAPVRYWKLKYAGADVMYRAEEQLINVTQVARALGHNRSIRWGTLDKRLGNFKRCTVKGRYIAGMYVSMTDAQRVLQQLRLPDVAVQELIRQVNEFR